jgi:glycosyltransferase involved in cell wall biosynthesis
VRLVVDGRPLVGNRTGIGVHTAEILRRLAIDSPLVASHREIEERDDLARCEFRVDPMPLGVLWQQIALPRIDADLLWGPHGTLPATWRKPSVVTLHDFTSITMPTRHRLKTILSFNLFIARSLDQTSHIAAVSQAVADEAVRGFGIASTKIEIVPNAVDDFFTPEGGEDDYILFSGTLEPRKGVQDLIAVWWSLPEPRPRLILAGDRGWRTTVPDHPRIEVTGYVTRERLRELYRHARLFVYPSHYEGFGIPPLEAMACGAPVIATRTGAIPEYGQGVAMFVSPGDLNELRSAMLRVLRDAELRRTMRTAGPPRAHLWNWERSARIMDELFAEAVRCA